MMIIMIMMIVMMIIMMMKMIMIMMMLRINYQKSGYEEDTMMKMMTLMLS